MAHNPVQFQKGISPNEFLSLYGTEEAPVCLSAGSIPDLVTVCTSI